MVDRLPVRKYIKVWVKRRKNNPKQDGSQTISYTLEWVEYGRRTFLSLGKHASLAYARQTAALKEKELNSLERHEALEPVSWEDFTNKYLDTFYPGHDFPVEQRREAEKKWPKSRNTMRRERLAIDNFGR